MRWARWVAALAAMWAALAGAQGIPSPSPDSSRPAIEGSPAEIRIEARGTDPWRVTWRLRKPAQQIVFPRSTDDNRVRTWIAGECCEIVRSGENEIARRRDGREFKEISLRVPPQYAVLPKDYAPFSPFGDGGMLFHTGRLFACAESCPENPRWRMRLSIPKGVSILLDGKRHARRARWIDSESGRNVYIGNNAVAQTEDLVAVIDRALPEGIRSQLSSDLPRFMHYFADKLGSLDARPMLFASYDAAFAQGYGRQGGTLPGQVFVHFYGAGWPQRMARPDFTNDLAWHFAHEAAHLYQRRHFDSRDGWIHEGAAEAFAAIALREQSPQIASFVQKRIDGARSRCEEGLREQSLRDQLGTGDFDLAYSCGLILNLALDAAIRRASPEGDGLFSVWRELLASPMKGSARTEEEFLAVLGRISDAAVAESVRSFVRTQGPDFAAKLP